MILGTFVCSVVYNILAVVFAIIKSPWYILKVSILWFCMVIALTYCYFLWTHQEYMARLRTALIQHLALGLWYGFLTSLALVGLYEFILRMLCLSKFFATSKDAICSYSLMYYGSERIDYVMGFVFIIISAWYICYLIEPFLAQWYDKKIVDGYGWLIIAGSLICSIFLWSITS